MRMQSLSGRPALDAAHDDVDGVREARREALHAAFLRMKLSIQRGRPSAPTNRPGGGARSGRRRPRSITMADTRPQIDADDVELALVPVRPGLHAGGARAVELASLAFCAVLDVLRGSSRSCRGALVCDTAAWRAARGTAGLRDQRLLPLLGPPARRTGADRGAHRRRRRRRARPGTTTGELMLSIHAGVRTCGVRSAAVRRSIVGDLHRVESGREPLLLAVVARALPECAAGRCRSSGGGR